MSKEWNIAAHEWCARVSCEYFLLRAEQRDEWLSRSAKGLSLVTVLNKETKRCIDALRAEQACHRPAPLARHADALCIARQVAEVMLPPLGPVRLLDVGSCQDFFRNFAEFASVALDLCPGGPTVYECDFLELQLSDGRTDVEVGNGAGRLLSLPRHSFSVAVVSQVLSFIPDPAARAELLAKTRTLLKQGDTRVIVIS